jgi:hypothetical protein
MSSASAPRAAPGNGDAPASALSIRVPAAAPAALTAEDMATEEEQLLSMRLAQLPSVEALRSGKAPTEVVGRDGRRYHGHALFCLPIAAEPRRSCIFLVEWPAFDTFILCIILANCATMAWTSPLDPSGTAKAAFIDVRLAHSDADAPHTPVPCVHARGACSSRRRTRRVSACLISSSSPRSPLSPVPLSSPSLVGTPPPPPPTSPSPSALTRRRRRRRRRC